MSEELLTVNLKESMNASWKERTPKIIRVLKKEVARRSDADEEEIRISEQLNEYIWARGIRRSMPRIHVKVVTDEDGVVTVRLPDEQTEEETEEKAEEKTEEEPALPEKAADEKPPEEPQPAQEPTTETPESQ